MTVVVRDRRPRPAPQRASSVLPSNHAFVTGLPASIPRSNAARSRTPAAAPGSPPRSSNQSTKLPPLLDEHRRESTVRGLNSAIAFVRTVDEVSKVQQRKFTGKLYVPPVPFGPNTPFVKTRAILGPEHVHLTDPSAAAVAATTNTASSKSALPTSSNGAPRGPHPNDNGGAGSTSTWRVVKAPVGSDDEDDSEAAAPSTPLKSKKSAQRPRRTRLPSGPAVADMPPELADGIRSVAAERLRLLFFPRLLRARRRRQLAKESTAALRHAPRVTAELLRKNALFSDWPAEALSVLISRLTYSFSEHRRVLMYRGEPAGCLMAVLMNGNYELLGVSSDANSSTTATTPGAKPRRGASVVVARVTAPNVLNEHTFLTAEPRITTVRLAPRSEVWTCDRAGFEAAMAALPSDIRAAVLDRAAAKRVRDLPRIFPATVVLLRQLSALAHCSTAFLHSLVGILRPVCYPPGTLLSAASAAAVPSNSNIPTALTLVVRGDCGTYRNLLTGPMSSGVSRRISSATATLGGDLSRTLISRFRGPCLVNEGSALLRVPPSLPNEFVETISTVDAYFAEADEIERLLSSHASDRQAIASYAQRRLLHQLSAQMMHHRSAVHSTPIVGRALSIDAVTALMSLFEARVYAPLSVICGASEPADKIIVLTKGSATIGTGRDRTKWALRESIGYTCVVPHRWAATVVAQETTETIELQRKYLVAFLDDCNALKDACVAARALMFPDAVFPPNYDGLIDAVRREEASRQTRPLYPIYAGVKEPSQHLMGMVPETTAPVTSLLGGLSAGALPSLKRLPLAEREAVEAEVEATFKPEYHRSLVKITQFLWLKQRGM